MKRLFRYSLYAFIFFTFISVVLFYNMGKILDTIEKPSRTDVIFSLGGGQKGDRTLKAIKLFKQGYSSSDILILTGDPRTNKMKKENVEEKRLTILRQQGLRKSNYLHKKDLKDTKEEIIFIKKYLLEKNYKKAIIVSDPPHTRRIKALFDLVDVKGDNNLKATVIGADTLWWDRRHYYKTKKGQVYALKESIKLAYVYFVYGFLDSIGVLHRFETMFLPYIQEINRRIYRKAYYYQRS